MKIEIRAIKYQSPEYKLEIELRNKVLRKPLGLQFLEEELLKEGTDIHLGAFSGEVLVGCLVITPIGQNQVKMRQVAVDKEYQGCGVGRRLVEESETVAKAAGYSEIVLNAREAVLDFYRKLNYQIFGEPFIEVTIPHRKMKKSLK